MHQMTTFTIGNELEDHFLKRYISIYYGRRKYVNKQDIFEISNNPKSKMCELKIYKHSSFSKKTFNVQYMRENSKRGF